MLKQLCTSIAKIFNLKSWAFLCYTRFTLLVCAGGQSSSRTPNMTPAGVFFSKGLLMIPAMPSFQAALSRGGLASSGKLNVHKLPPL